MPMTEGTSLRSRVPRKWHARVCSRGGGSDPFIDCNRSIPPGVLWRKGSFGTQGAEGSRFVESMLTVVATLKQQRRKVLESLPAACEAALRGEAAPSLLPASDQQSQAAA